MSALVIVSCKVTVMFQQIFPEKQGKVKLNSDWIDKMSGEMHEWPENCSWKRHE